MVYFGSFGTYNFCLRGLNSGVSNPATANGMFNSAMVSCFGWPYWDATAIGQGKSSWGKYIYQCSLPYVNTLKTTNSNLQIDTQLRYQGRPFSLNLDSGMGIEYVRFIGQTANAGAGTTSTYVQGYKNMGLTSRGNYQTIAAVAAYSFTFANWRLNTSSGTIVTTSAQTNLYYNSTYGGTNFANIQTIFASAT